MDFLSIWLAPIDWQVVCSKFTFKKKTGLITYFCMFFFSWSFIWSAPGVFDILSLLSVDLLQFSYKILIFSQKKFFLNFSQNELCQCLFSPGTFSNEMNEVTFLKLKQPVFPVSLRILFSLGSCGQGFRQASSVCVTNA